MRPPRSEPLVKEHSDLPIVAKDKLQTSFMGKLGLVSNVNSSFWR